MEINYGSPLFNAAIVLAASFATWVAFEMNGVNNDLSAIIGTMAVPLVLSVIVTGIASLIRGNVNNRGNYFITTFMIIAMLTVAGRLV